MSPHVNADAHTARHPRSAQDAERWLIGFLAEVLDLDERQIDAHASFDRLGLDSSAAVGITDAFGKWLGYEVSPTALYDHPTIEELARHVAADAPARAA